MAGKFSIEAVFKAVDRVTAPVTRMQNRVGKFTRKMERGFRRVGKSAARMAAGLKSGLRIAGGAMLAFGAIMANVIGVGSSFGRAIGSAAAKFPEDIKRGTKAFKDLEAAARKVGATTEFTATQAAQGLNFLAKAGFSAKFSMMALKDIVDFATSSEMEFAEAADIASDALGAFGLDSKNTTVKMANMRRIMDVMSKTANSTNVSVAEMFETVKKGAPVAIKAGQSLETFAAITGVLAGVGIKGSEAGTATKNIALALAGVGNAAGKTFKQLNIALTKNGKMRDVADVFEDLSAATKDMDEDKLLGVVNAIFGKISLASAANLLGGGADKIRTLRKELEKASGFSKKTAEFIRDDVKGSIDGLTSAVDGVKISIFSLNEGPLKAAIDRMTEWVRTNEKVIASGLGNFLLGILNNLEGIVKWVKRIGIALGVFLAFTAILKTLVAVLTLVNLVMAANPITLIVLGVLALVAAFGTLVVFIDDVVAAFDNMSGVAYVVLTPLRLILKALKFIKDNFGVVTRAASAIGSVLGFTSPDGEEDTDVSFGPEISSPQDRTARLIEERRETSTADVTIRDETGRAELKTKGPMTGVNLQLASSGGLLP